MKFTLIIPINLGIALGILFVSALLFMNLSEFLKEIDDENCKEENTQSTFTAAVVEIEVETSDLCKHVTNIFGSRPLIFLFFCRECVVMLKPC